MAFVRGTASELDMFPMDSVQLTPGHEQELPKTSVQYHIDEGHTAFAANGIAQGVGHMNLLFFVPLSWTGIRLDETMSLGQFTFEPRTPRWFPALASPEFVQTFSIASTCAAVIRILAKVSQKSIVRQHLLADLSGMVAYCLFDMSYEGNYMDIPGNDVPLSDKEKQDIETAVADIQAWPFPEDETWMRDFLVQAVRGERDYRELPALEDAATGKASIVFS